MIRMTNVSILPGEKPLSLEQLIAATDEGIYMETNKSWSIDDKRYNFQFGCEIALGDQARQARADAEESFVFRDHHGVLEFDGRDLLARRVDDVGNSELRQGPAAAGCGDGTWRESGPVQEYSRWFGVFVETGLTSSRLRGVRCAVWRRGKLRLCGKFGMLTQEQAADIFDRIRRFSSADEVEAIFNGSRFALTRFANNTIHQNVEEENSIVSIRTNFGGRTARSTANQFDDESLQSGCYRIGESR